MRFLSMELTIMPKLILCLWITVLIHSVDSNNVHYIAPSQTTPCPGIPCLTLSTLAANSINYFGSNSTVAVTFLEGNHTLDTELVISNINGSLMLSTNGSDIVAIVCSGNASLELLDITHLQISGLVFLSCRSKVEHVDHFILKDSWFKDGSTDSALHLNHTNTSILRSSFVSNTLGTYQSHVRILAHLLRNFHDEIPNPTDMPDIQSTSARVGGALVVTSSTVSISSSHFVGNAAKVGGAIFSRLGSNINIDDCTFVNNSATGCSDDGCLGGALFIDSGCTVTAHNSTFMNNRAEYSGGAIALFQGTFLDSTHNVLSSNRAGVLGGAISAYSKSRIAIDTSSYCNNTGEDGGAIYAYGYSSIIVNNTSFDNNESGQNGGAVYARYSSYSISSSSFHKNKADNGGVLYAWNSNSSIDNYSYFGHNEARYDGVVCASTNSSITVSNSSFESNAAGSDGGVIYVSNSSIITMGYSSFNNNTAGVNGGVMTAYSSSSITVGNCSFDSNSAGNNGGVAVAYFNSSIILSSSSFISSRAAYDGGVMCAQDSSNIIVGGSFFDSNTAGNVGGVGDAFIASSIFISDSVFESNEAGSYGGVLLGERDSSITVSNSSFVSNKANNSGGVMIAYRNSNITVGNSSFNKNKGTYNGGVMGAYFNSSINVGNSSFNKNTAGHDGGVIFAYSSRHITIGNSSFDDNIAVDDGGVIYAQGSSSSVTVGNCSFGNNTANDDGGVMGAYSDSSIIVGNSVFHNNTAERNGGVMVEYYSGYIAVANSLFDNNTANSRGGVAFGYSSRTKINNCTMCNSFASEGGAAYLLVSYLRDVGSLFFRNMATNGGVITLNLGVVEIAGSKFVNNTATEGGVLYTPFHHSIIHPILSLKTSWFINNHAVRGGAIAVFFNATVSVSDCIFIYNSAVKGGVIYLLEGNNLTTNYSNYTYNLAESDGGVIYLERLNRLKLRNCELNFNRADNKGGVVCLIFNNEFNITEDITFTGNEARSGGVAYIKESITNIHSHTLLVANNTAMEYGGAIYSLEANLNFFSGSYTLVGNCADDGGAIYAEEGTIDVYTQTLLIANNLAMNTGGAVYVCKASFTFFGGKSSVTLVQNQAHSGGALYVSKSKVKAYNASLLIVNNTARDTGGAVYLSKTDLYFINGSNSFIGNEANTGGAIYLNEAQMVFSGGNSDLVRNRASDGGALYISKSKFVVEIGSQTIVYANFATHYGGGLYLATSELNVKGESLLNITGNTAQGNGGGIHATNSFIIVERAVFITKNTAENGGGISLETNAVLRGTSAEKSHINLVANRASHYGGALYVDDETNPGMCKARNVAVPSTINVSTECFINSVFINVSYNSAGISGSNLFGGLLDRCTVNSSSSSFLSSSNINKSELDTIASHSIRLCFCRDSKPDCSYQPESILINRGKSFSIELTAYDQVHRAVSARIQCFHNLSAGGLGEGQQIQNMKPKCTELRYKVFTTNDYVRLTFSAERDPCSNISEVSKRSILLNIICSCPIGFQLVLNNDKVSCDCVCDPVLQWSKKIECNQTAESIIRRDLWWITYINHTWSNLSGYVIYPHCPFDYCYTPDKEVSINLNLPNGSDAQCAHNRMGTLCGTCKPGLSVSVGTSKCIPCPAYWPGLLVTIIIVFIISGIGLVTFLLALNLTVAIGTLNAVIFYANIVVANKSALFPSGRSPASVFISWLNFDISFDVCFFDGMDTYTKTWLQLAFPAYIIILVVVIIQLSYYFNAFGHLVGKKDPVATLATLILLSYTKLLQITITAFSSATLVYPDGSKKSLWLSDATIAYCINKHAVLLFIAILILVVGFIYTILLFSHQWFLCFPRRQVKWIKSQKLSSFMEIYLIPYTPQHRYWTGLLLLVRVSVYLVSAFNPSGDPRVTLLATNFIMASLFLYIAIFRIRIYKNYLIHTMEMIVYFNIIALCTFIWYTIDFDTNQTVITSISVGITFIQFIAIVVYHAYKHMNQKMFSTIQGSAACIQIREKLIQKLPKRAIHKPLPADDNIHHFLELLDLIDIPANANGYKIPQVQPKPVELTQSVVELPASPSPLEAMEEEPDLEFTEQQDSKQEGINTFPVTEENKAIEIYANKQCINNYSGIEMAECNESGQNCETEMEHRTIRKQNSIPKPGSSPQVRNIPLTESCIVHANHKNALEIPQSDNVIQSTQEVSSFQADNGSQRIIVEAEVHSY